MGEHHRGGDLDALVKSLAYLGVALDPRATPWPRLRATGTGVTPGRGELGAAAGIIGAALLAAG